MDQLPNVQGELERLIDLRVETILRARGLVTASPDCRQIRIEKGLTIQDLASRAGISHVALGKIESGKTKNPAPETLNSIARALGVPEVTYRSAFSRKAG